nr:gag pol polyprotein [Hymenolepis microstoma]
MSNEVDLGMRKIASPLTYPIFDPKDPRLWLELESSFQRWGIDKKRSMFQNAFSALPTNVAAQVIAIIDKSLKGKCFDAFKGAVISHLCGSQERHRTPSHLLRHMRSLADGTEVSDLIRKQFRMDYPSVNIAARIVTNAYRSNPAELAETNDWTQELYVLPCAHAIETLAPSPVTPQDPDMHSKLLEKIESILSNISEFHDCSS